MIKDEIIEGNKLIGEFLGSKWINDAPEDYPNGYYYQPEGIEDDCPTGIPEDWCFNDNWCWLMPVVEKIESIKSEYHGHFGVYISSNTCTIQATNFRPDMRIPDPPHYFNTATVNNKLDATWLVVVQFIKWYTFK